MRNVRRFYYPDAVYFITAVTYDRIALLQNAAARIFLETVRKAYELRPFRLYAYALMPDHVHLLLRSKRLEATFSDIVASIKRNFTFNLKKSGILPLEAIPAKIWQDRFYDHMIRSEEDLKKHFDYIHYNPVKHGYVKQPEDWEFSSYQYWLRKGEYEIGWGHLEEPPDIRDMDLE